MNVQQENISPAALQRKRVIIEDRIKHLTQIMHINRNDRDYCKELQDEIASENQILKDTIQALKIK